MTSKLHFPPRLEFGTLLAYPPRYLAEGWPARLLVFTIKRDGPSATAPVSLIQLFVRRIPAVAPAIRAMFLDGTWLAVPVPTSRPTTMPNSVWASRSICQALLQEGFVQGIAEIVQRTTALRVKASHTKARRRPTTLDHYNTMAATAPVGHAPKKVLLVDDVLSSGGTAVGTAARLLEVVPHCEVRVFAMARTVEHHVASVDPRTGYIDASSITARRVDAA